MSEPQDGASYHVGVDENGLGPRLGPLIVTAVMARVAPGAEPALTRKPRGGLAKRLGDSKALVSHGNVTLGEIWSRALAERGALGSAGPATAPQDLVDGLSLDDRAALRQHCPRHVLEQCWSTAGEGFAEDGDAAALLKAVRGDLRRLAQRGVDVVAARSVILCTRRLNLAVEQGLSRFAVDLHAMERLVIALRELAGQDLHATCGKVGGYDEYSKVFGPLGGQLHSVIEQGRARSRYRFPGLGEIAFVRDCDAGNLLVGMASLVGKHLRELLMARIVAYYRRCDPALTRASGYHDPVTGAFVAACTDLRRRRRVPDVCFERRRLPPLAERRKQADAQTQPQIKQLSLLERA